MHLLVAIILLALFATWNPARPQEHRHPPEHAALHDEFYKDWMMPDAPLRSCCNQQDCAPVQHVERRNGHWWMQRVIDSEWLEIPDAKIEMNRDTPDGRSHMCSSGASVFCAIVGIGG